MSDSLKAHSKNSANSNIKSFSKTPGTGWGWWGWVNYTSAPTTIGNRLVFSSWTLANLITESSMIFTSPNTLNWNNTIQTGDTQFDQNYNATYTGVPNQISCVVWPVFATPYAAAPTTQYAEIIISYNNGVNPVVNKTIKTVLDGSNQTVSFVTATTTGSVTVSRAAWSVTVTVASGNPAHFSITSLCRYNGVPTNTYQNKIHTYDGDIFDYNNVRQSFFWSTLVFDSTSQFIHNGLAVFNTLNANTINATTLNVNTITQNWVPISGIDIQQVLITGDGVTTTFPLGFTPIAGDKYTQVSNEFRLYLHDAEYTVTWSNITFSVAPSSGQEVQVRSFISMWVLSPWPTITWITLIKKAVTAAMTGTTLVVPDTDCTTTSIITRTAQTAPVGFIEFLPGTWSFTINSSSSETSLIFNYVLTK